MVIPIVKNWLFKIWWLTYFFSSILKVQPHENQVVKIAQELTRWPIFSSALILFIELWLLSHSLDFIFVIIWFVNEGGELFDIKGEILEFTGLL